MIIPHYNGGELSQDVAKAYLESLRDHVRFVQEAGTKLDVPEEQLLIHDLSKFSQAEFTGYALHFKGGGAPDLFASAWLNHIHRNPHHPEHWRFPGDYCPKGANIVRGCLKMPHHYLMEHIADLMGASMAYTGSWDLSDWLSKNMSRMYYHPETARVLRQELDTLGYADIVFTHKFGHEIIDDER